MCIKYDTYNNTNINTNTSTNTNFQLNNIEYLSNPHFNFTKKNKRLKNQDVKNKYIDNNNQIQTTECAAIIMDITCKNILLIKQRLSDKWGLPKGHMEQKEIDNFNTYNCIKREIYEETGIIIENKNHKNNTLVDIRPFNSKYYNRILFVFIINEEIKRINLNPHDLKEICDIKWIEIKDLHSFIKNKDCNTSLRNVDIFNYIVKEIQHFQ